MNKIITLLVCFFTAIAWSQQIIKVRPQHSKQNIYTLREGEYIGNNESKVHIKTNGIDYEFTTFYNYKMYQHFKGRSPKRIWPLRYGFIESITTDDRQKILRNTLTGQKYGPYESLIPLYNSKSKTIYGIKYWQKGKQYIKVKRKTYGPYDKISTNFINQSELAFTFEENGETFISINQKIHGPFQAVKYHTFHPAPHQKMGLYIYLNAEGWHFLSPDFKDITFRGKPYAIYNTQLQEWKVFGKPVGKDNVRYMINPGGSMIQQNSESHIVLNSNKDTLYFKRVQGESENSFSSNLYEVTYKDSLIGTFIPNNKARFNQVKTDFFPVTLSKNQTNTTDIYAEKDQHFFFSPTSGLIGPIKDKFVYQLMFFNHSYAYVNQTDSTLVVDGHIEDRNIIAADYSGYPKAVWLLKAEGYLHQSYRNGKKTTANLPPLLSYYNTPNKPYILIKKGDDFLLKPRGSNRLLGPVERGGEYAIAKDKQTYVECRLSDQVVLINGKITGKGFGIAYNQNQNTFHWFSLTNQKLYLHTYEID